ncbi:NAD-dependent epimerase/dehydratase family protein [Prevotella disiens]|uniref:NAD-dependent epimerase/dehydratase family protein n=1 Tax=Prevotella disiens TaxID=28130 RepID=UPI00336A38A0
MKILVTGATGFVGENLKPYLEEKGHIIYTLGRSDKYTWKDLSAKNIPEVDAIIHLAGKAHDLKKVAGNDIYFKVNRDLTMEIYNYFLASKTQKFIFFSSVKAAADFLDNDILTEDVNPNPVGSYGKSKQEAEKYILSNLSSDKEVYILRPCMMHGPKNKGNLNLLYKVVSKNIPWPLGKFDNKRSFASISNVCYIVNTLLEKKIESGIYNVSDDAAISTNELIEIICKACNKKSHILFLSKWLISSIAKIGDYIHLPLNTERLTKLTENYVVSNQKIRKALGISKLPFSTKEGLTTTIRSFQNKE